MTDPFVGQLAFVRVYSGHLQTGDQVLNARTGNTERIGRLLKMHANKREEMKELFAGDIAAVVGLRNVVTGDTICDPKAPDRARGHAVPRAGHRRGHRARRPRPTRTSSALALGKLTQEDPTFRVHTDPETGQTIISGMGELHLEIIVDRLVREFKVGANGGQAAGRLPRDDQAGGAAARAGSSSRPAGAASTGTSRSASSPSATAATTSS